MGYLSTMGSILAEDLVDEVDLSGIGRLLALTPNHRVNALAALHFSELFGEREVYQLADTPATRPKGMLLRRACRGKPFFMNPPATR